MQSPVEFSASRRGILRALLAAAAFPLTRFQATAEVTGVRPFRIAIPQATLDRILRRVREAQWPDRLDATGWEYGANWDYMKDLAAYWTAKFDWRKAEARLNRYPQFMARVDDFDVHFYHVRGKGPRPMPLILTHGWPGSVVEFQEAIGPLTDPAAFGGSANDSFDVVVPSLPGCGFTSKPRGTPVGPPSVARLWRQLMTGVLGYNRFAAQGGDIGSIVSIQMANRYPDSLIGLHINSAVAGPARNPAELTEEERAFYQSSAAARSRESDYAGEQRNKPQTIGFLLADSPLGAAAWIVEKLKGWSDSGNNIETAFSKDQILTNVMWHLVSNTAATAVWLYRGSAADAPRDPQIDIQQRMKVPTAFAAFPGELPFGSPPESILRREFNLVRYTKMPRGGHFACFEQPQLLVGDVREFFRQFRT
jgi:pimeloyl-ACP methyl ester carboxylesterase